MEGRLFPQVIVTEHVQSVCPIQIKIKNIKNIIILHLFKVVPFLPHRRSTVSVSQSPENQTSCRNLVLTSERDNIFKDLYK